MTHFDTNEHLQVMRAPPPPLPSEKLLMDIRNDCRII